MSRDILWGSLHCNPESPAWRSASRIASKRHERLSLMMRRVPSSGPLRALDCSFQDPAASGSDVEDLRRRSDGRRGIVPPGPQRPAADVLWVPLLCSLRFGLQWRFSRRRRHRRGCLRHRPLAGQCLASWSLELQDLDLSVA